MSMQASELMSFGINTNVLVQSVVFLFIYHIYSVCLVC